MGDSVSVKDYRLQKDGFTLLEIMLVIAVIGLLAAIAIPNYISYRDNGFCTQAESDADAVASALMDYFSVPSRTALPTVEELGVETLNPVTISGVVNDTIVVMVKDRTGRCPKDYQTPHERWDENTNTFTKYVQ